MLPSSPKLISYTNFCIVSEITLINALFKTFKQFSKLKQLSIPNVRITHVISAQFYEQGNEKRVDNATRRGLIRGVWKWWNDKYRFCLLLWSELFIDCKTVVFFANTSDGKRRCVHIRRKVWSECKTRPAGVWGSRASHSRITLTALRAFRNYRKRLFCSLNFLGQ